VQVDRTVKTEPILHVKVPGELKGTPLLLVDGVSACGSTTYKNGARKYSQNKEL